MVFKSSLGDIETSVFRFESIDFQVQFIDVLSETLEFLGNSFEFSILGIESVLEFSDLEFLSVVIELSL